jgi:hypothetical protein
VVSAVIAAAGAEPFAGVLSWAQTVVHKSHNEIQNAQKNFI